MRSASAARARTVFDSATVRTSGDSEPPTPRFVSAAGPRFRYASSTFTAKPFPDSSPVPRASESPRTRMRRSPFRAGWGFGRTGGGGGSPIGSPIAAAQREHESRREHERGRRSRDEGQRPEPETRRLRRRASHTGADDTLDRMASAEIVLSAENLTKRFGDREAVSDVSFDVRAGEVFGFLGPNGAGKTTTIRMLVGLARPDRGSVRIRGLDLARHFTQAMAHVGAIVESPDLYRYLTGRENLEHFARMLPAGAGGRIDELGAMVALSERLDDKVSTYSLGMRQRLGIAQALLGEPDVLILDEPANGLDPAGIREIRQLVRRLAAERGIARLRFEPSALRDRADVRPRGDHPPRADARRGLGARALRPLGLGSRARARAPRGAGRGDALGIRRRRNHDSLRGAPGDGDGDGDGVADGVVTARIPPDRVPEALRALLSEGIEVFTVERPSSTLEEVFLEITGGETV